MDFSPVINQIIEMWYVFLIFILILVIKTPWFKGVCGELFVNFMARIFLDKEKYHLIKNVTLPTEDGTTQIDHVIVSRYGVFVVETKNMKGWIFGRENQRMWTQQIYKHKNKFYNPLYQNYKHVKTLGKLLELSDEQIFSVVVFVGDSTFKTTMPENVTQGFGYIKFIKSKNCVVFTDDEVEKIVAKIEAVRMLPSFATDREHVKHVKNIIDKKKNSG